MAAKMARMNRFCQKSILAADASRRIVIPASPAPQVRGSDRNQPSITLEIIMTQQALAVEQPIVRNGVNVSALGQTIQAVKANREIAQFQFRARNRWMGGDHNRSTIDGFHGACQEMRHAQAFDMDNGEPSVLLGADRHANPVEYVLHALAGCLTTTMAYHAAARGIAIEAIDSTLEGDLDLRGFLGLSDEVRKGFHAIRVRMRVKSSAGAAQLRELTKFSPVYDIVSKSLPVDVSVETC
jgi:uncharacterized OsmC-like protein